ncbi:MAG TPA: gliding motility-associated C-terminal domain-containing protein [Bacteroidetes bacterium]|nr:gliding motility-associated C-terminal domain-containing protein [Bacteroidota bacterium]
MWRRDNKNYYLFIFLSFTGILSSQNLVDNPGFESYSSCPTMQAQLALASPWHSPAGSITTPDLLNSCATFMQGCFSMGVPYNRNGYTPPRSGSGYAGILTKYPVANLREYLQAPLNSSLISGEIYEVSMYVILSDSCRYATDNMGMYLTNGAVSQTGTPFANQPIYVTPQIEHKSVITDTANWVKVGGLYFAQGGEDHVTIGNFRSDAGNTVLSSNIPYGSCGISGNTAYYFIDDVSVTTCIFNMQISGDTVICQGDSSHLNASGNNTYGWYNVSDLNLLLSNQSSLDVKPDSSITYIVYGDIDTGYITVNVLASINFNLGSDTTLCIGDTLTSDINNGSYSFLWNDGSILNYNIIDQTGLFWLEIQAGASCSFRDSIQVSMLELPLAELGNDTMICEGNSIILDVSQNGVNYIWKDGSSNASLNVNTSGTYFVRCENQCEQSSDTISVQVEQCSYEVFLPNAFSPNGDGVNDVLYVRGLLISTIELKVFDRFGKLVFENKDINNGWDGKHKGKILSSGVFAYELTAVFADGNEKYMKGAISLVH